MLCHQLIDGSAEYAERVSLELNEQEIPTVTEVKLIGRRKQDKENLEKQIINEDAKASRMTRTPLTIEAVQAVALTTKPTNNATFTFDGIVLLWREKVEQMCKVKFWNELKPKPEYKQTWKIARRAMIWIDALSLPPPK